MNANFKDGEQILGILSQELSGECVWSKMKTKMGVGELVKKQIDKGALMEV